jgi:hypothetical protein
MNHEAVDVERTSPSTTLRGQQIRFTLRPGRQISLTAMGPPEYAGMELLREHGLCTTAVWNVNVDIEPLNDPDLEWSLDSIHLDGPSLTRTAFVMDLVDIHPHEAGRRPCCNYDPQHEPGPDAMRWSPDAMRWSPEDPS